ncbi:hypothetical protein JDV02_004711 [Purpureocillium takamizusanense]|uniref:Zn(2)-C6 fungal-type domain-containing protein n=1 Tax=Purpureocillium takamizusanense TaxID=2060973 RepID=A0A9Q8QEF3_9HYPO|nr:uncharacterized protein JDV02_004711 [Purpureocillium takamizusanense]UNI18443.1 hypothetical protein JDV02_004711 [Purpureocillium takamizusanense]
MPRVYNKEGDEVRPVCGLCSSKGLFCTRSEKPVTFIPQQGPSSKRKHVAVVEEEEKVTREGEQPDIAVASSPRVALARADTAAALHHYVSAIAAWYDLGDPARHFATVVPLLALEEPLLFCGVVAVAAMHLGKTTTTATTKTAGARAALAMAGVYHAECVARLIALGEGSALLENGVALATVCLLRSYEILDEEIDPNRHLQGAYSLASRRGLLNDAPNALFTAGFWNYLREDISFSLFQGCPLKMDLNGVVVPPGDAALPPGHLHAASLILGRVINAVFQRPVVGSEEWMELLRVTKAWYGSLSSAQKPFSRIEGAGGGGGGGELTKVWFLEDSHASAMHYFLTICCILTISASPEQLAHLPPAHDGAAAADDSAPSRDDLLDGYASEICAIAFTARIPSVLVNAFGPMSYSAKYIRNAAVRHGVLGNLTGCKRVIGWPAEKLMDDLKAAWWTAGGN